MQTTVNRDTGVYEFPLAYAGAKGIGLSAIDCMIATLCIQQGYRLLRRGRDFNAFERLLGARVVQPAG